MGIGREQAQYMAEVAKFNKGDGWNSINGVSVMSKDRFYLKGSQFFESPFSNGIGDELSGCWLRYPRLRKDADARRACQESFDSRQNAEIQIAQQQQQLAQQALQADTQSQWSVGRVIAVSVVSLLALTGMVIAIKKYAK